MRQDLTFRHSCSMPLGDILLVLSSSARHLVHVSDQIRLLACLEVWLTLTVKCLYGGR
jgi:hypothetical protein